MTVRPEFLKTQAFFEYAPPRVGDQPGDLRILLHTLRSRWIIGNKTFSEIARLLTEGKNCNETGLVIADRYGIDPALALRDVRQVEEQLKTHRFMGEDKQASLVRVPQLTNLFLYVTDRCNLACSHCYYTGTSCGDLSPERYKRMVDEMAGLGGTGIALSGGEALLHPDLKELLSYGSSRCALTLLTNGTLLDKGWASFLAGLDRIHIQISLDGSRNEIHDAIRGQGTFEKVLRAIGLLQDAGLGKALNLCTTVMAGNLADLPGIIELGERLGIPRMRFLPLRKTGRAAKQWCGIGADVKAADDGSFFDHILDQQQRQDKIIDINCGLDGIGISRSPEVSPDDIWCTVGNKIVVTPRGDAYPCQMLQTEDFFLGNVFRDGLASAMSSERMYHMCAILAERRNKIDECAVCCWKNFCQAGCMGEAFEAYGTVWAKGKFCSCRKNLYEKAFSKLCRPASV